MLLSSSLQEHKLTTYILTREPHVHFRNRDTNFLNFLGEQLGNPVGGFLHAMASFGFSAVKLCGLV
jgi:hypothetical protein